MVILLLFFCSGATALIYEVVWSKYLALLLGSTIQAQTVVLAVFMGGLALGNRLFGKYADRARHPLKLYGGIEIAIGCYAFFFSFFYQMTDGFFAAVGSKFLDHAGPLLLFKGVLSVALLLIPTVLMGGTLPVLAAWLEKNTADASRRSARFYSTNSLGAVCGAGLAGFFLVQRFGLSRTIELTAVVNVLIGLIAAGIGRMQTTQLPTVDQKSETLNQTSIQSTSTMFRWSCMLVALTGAVSMGLEVLASRCLILIFGASLQVFAIVLMAFILGIGLGSAVIASPHRRQWSKEILTVGLLLAAAVMIGLLVFNIENLATVYLSVQSGLSRTAMGYRLHEIFTSVVSILVLGLPAAALGSVLPLWIRGSETSHRLADRVGRLLTWNTLGAVGGVLLTGFVLLPEIGLRGSFTTVALVLAVAAIVMALATQQRIAVVAGVVIAMLVALVAVSGDEDWRYVFSSGVFRLSGDDSPRMMLQERRKLVNLLFYEDGSDATVSVESAAYRNASTNLTLRINGKPDATSRGDLSTQILLAQLPLMMKPDSKDVFCFGMGSGITAGSVLGYPIEHLTVAENCAPVLRAAKLFEPWNNGVLTNNRARIFHEDARTVLKLNVQKYDVIISEPSNPWMIGVGSVFSREFYELAASRLKMGGIMTQWFHTYELDDRTLNLVLRTFGAVFPNMEIWDVGDGDIVLLGSSQPWKSDLETYNRAFQLEGPRRDLSAIGLTSAETVMARQLASQRTAYALSGPGLIQSDDMPVLEYEAPRAFYIYLERRAEDFQHFDERTWQIDLANRDKNTALSKMDAASLNAIFGQDFPSANLELLSYLRMSFEGRINQDYALASMPCIFQGTNGMMLFAPYSAQTNMISRELFQSEYALKTMPGNQLQAIEGIKKILDGVQNYKRQDTDWSAAHYTDLAVKASLRFGNAAQAKSILLRGLQLEPDSEELKYLSRILAREETLQPAEFPPAITNNADGNR
jgi:spermidine synthase